MVKQIVMFLKGIVARDFLGLRNILIDKIEITMIVIERQRQTAKFHRNVDNGKNNIKFQLVGY